MVERVAGRGESDAVPTIAELLTAYRDRTGMSYRRMAQKVRDEIHGTRLQVLATEPPKEFPKNARTIEVLAELLEVPVATIVLAFAAGLGIPVRQGGTMLERTLPPGTDTLTAEDREAIRYVTRALVDARTVHRFIEGARQLEQAQPADYGLAARRGDSEGRRLREQQDTDAES